MLSFKCMATLFDPVHRRGSERIKWGLVSYTGVMFSLATVITAMNVNVISISYIDNRGFPGVEGVVPPGPYGYLMFIPSEAIEVIPDAMFNLSDWLADGLLVSSLFRAPLDHPGI